MRIGKKNSVPFFILIFIHTFLIGVTVHKRMKIKKSIYILLLSNMGFAYLFEYFVLNVFKGYIYKPKVLKNHSLDNVFGAFLSQGIFVPFTAVYLTMSKAGWMLKLFGSMYFTFIEILFLKLGVYNHRWWKTIFTFILIPFYFKWSDFWYSCMMKNKEVIRFISLFMMIMVTETNLFLLLAIIRKFRFGLGKVHTWTEHFIISPLYSITISLFTAFILRKYHDGRAKIVVILVAASLNWFFVRIKLLKNNLGLKEYIFIRTVMVIIYGQYRKWVYGKKMRKNRTLQ